MNASKYIIKKVKNTNYRVGEIIGKFISIRDFYVEYL